MEESHEHLARQLLRDAEALESAGDATAAVAALRRAYKLCPKLALGEDEASAESSIAVPLVDSYERLPPQDSQFRTFDAAGLRDEAARSEIRRYLDDEGFVVLDGVLTPEEVAVAFEHFAAFMRCAGIDVRDARTMARPFGDPGTGIVRSGGSGQSSLCWFVRSRQAVKDAFRLALASRGSENESASRTQKLICCFTGFNWLRNPEVGGDSWGGSKQPWMHFDADDHANSCYVQGIVNLVDTSDAMDAGLVLLPRSHATVFPHVVTSKRKENPTYLTYIGAAERRVVASLEVRERAFRVPLKAGSMVLWKSSVMHCNTGCAQRAALDASQLVRRLAVYTCMCSDPCDAQLSKRRGELLTQGATTMHQPDIPRLTNGIPLDGSVEQKVVLTNVQDLPEGAAELL